jgi:DNA-directed RNA polymerase specialized sigma24 family protein
MTELGLGHHTQLASQSVADAISGLSREDLLRLKVVAGHRTRSLGRAAAGNTADDLLSEAIRQTLDGTRPWDQSYPLVAHMLQCIRGIAWNWKVKKSPELVYETDLCNSESSRTGYDSDRTANRLEEQISANEILDQLRARLSDDPVALKVLELLYEGYSADDAAQMFDVPKRPFKAALKRIRRAARADFK